MRQSAARIRGYVLALGIMERRVHQDAVHAARQKSRRKQRIHILNIARNYDRPIVQPVEARVLRRQST